MYRVCRIDREALYIILYVFINISYIFMDYFTHIHGEYMFSEIIRRLNFHN